MPSLIRLPFVAGTAFTGNDAATALDAAVVLLSASDAGTAGDAALAPYVADTATAAETAVVMLALFDTSAADDLYRNPPVQSYLLAAAESVLGTGGFAQTVAAFETVSRVEVASVTASIAAAETATTDDDGLYPRYGVDAVLGAEAALAPLASEAALAVFDIDRAVEATEEAFATVTFVGDRLIDTSDAGAALDAIVNKTMFVADDFLAMDEAAFGHAAADAATATEAWRSGRVVREIYDAVDVAAAGEAGTSGGEAASGRDAGVLVVVVSAAESAAFAESAAPLARVAGAESAAFADVASPNPGPRELSVAAAVGTVQAAVQAADGGTLSERASPAAASATDDAAYAGDAGSLRAATPVADAATAADVALPNPGPRELSVAAAVGTVQAAVQAFDAFSFRDAGSPLASVSVADAFAGADAASLRTLFAVADAGATADTLLPSFLIVERATLAEVPRVLLSAAESAQTSFGSMAPLAVDAFAFADAAGSGCDLRDVFRAVDVAAAPVLSAGDDALTSFFATPALTGDAFAATDGATAGSEPAERAAATEAVAVAASVPGGDAAVLRDRGGVAASVADADDAVAEDEAALAALLPSGEGAVAADDGALAARHDVNGEEAFADEAASVTVVLDCEDAGDVSGGAYAVPTGVTFVDVQTQESYRDEPLDVYGGRYAGDLTPDE